MNQSEKTPCVSEPRTSAGCGLVTPHTTFGRDAKLLSQRAIIYYSSNGRVLEGKSSSGFPKQATGISKVVKQGARNTGPSCKTLNNQESTCRIPKPYIAKKNMFALGQPKISTAEHVKRTYSLHLAQLMPGLNTTRPYLRSRPEAIGERQSRTTGSERMSQKST